MRSGLFLCLTCLLFCEGSLVNRSDLLDCLEPHHNFLRCIEGEEYGIGEACLFNNGYYDMLYAARNLTIWNSNVGDPNWYFARYCNSFPPLPLCHPLYDSNTLYLPLDKVAYDGYIYTRIGSPSIDGGDPNNDKENWKRGTHCDPVPTTHPPSTKGQVRTASRSKTVVPNKIDCADYINCPRRVIDWREICVTDGKLWKAANKEGAQLPPALSDGNWNLLAECSKPPVPLPCDFPEWRPRKMYWRYDRITHKGIQYRANLRHVNSRPDLRSSLAVTEDADDTMRGPKGEPKESEVDENPILVWREERECVTQEESGMTAVTTRGRAGEVLDLVEIDCCSGTAHLLRCVPKTYAADSTCVADNKLWTTPVTQTWPNSDENGYGWYPAFSCGSGGMPEIPACSEEVDWDPEVQYQALDRVHHKIHIWEARFEAEKGVAPAFKSLGWDVLTPCSNTTRSSTTAPLETSEAVTPLVSSFTSTSISPQAAVDCTGYLDWFPWRQFNYKEVVRYFTPSGDRAWEVVWEEGAIRDYPPRSEYGWRLLYNCTGPVMGDCDIAEEWRPKQYTPTERVRWKDVLWEATCFVERGEEPSLASTGWRSTQQCSDPSQIVPSVVP